MNHTTSTRRLAKRRRSRRAWSEALIWKDYRYLGGGVPGMIVRVVLYTAVVWTIYLLMVYQGRPYQHDAEMLRGIMIWIAIAGLMLESSMMAAHVFRDEIRWQTLSAIMILPISLPKLAYAKIAGCTLALLPAMLLLFVGVMQLPARAYDLIEDVFVEPGFWLTVSVALFFLHLVAFLSLYMKWGALAAALAVMFIGWFVLGMVMFMFIAARNLFSFDTVAVIGIIVLLGLSVLLQLLCGRKLVQLASQ